LYYVLDAGYIPDHKYDAWEKELASLCNQYPEIARSVEFWNCCPSHTVGSSDPEKYPIQIIRTAEWLLEYNRTHGGI
jgi:NAD-dependent DNA ligase